MLDVLRDKQKKELEMVLDMSRFLVSQYDDFDAIPLYVVVGGCVFGELFQSTSYCLYLFS